jgi:hypothetical protein
MECLCLPRVCVPPSSPATRNANPFISVSVRGVPISPAKRSSVADAVVQPASLVPDEKWLQSGLLIRYEMKSQVKFSQCLIRHLAMRRTERLSHIAHLGARWTSGAGAGFLRVLRFPLPIFIPPIAPQSPSSIIWGLYNRLEVAAVPSGLIPTPLIIIIIIKAISKGFNRVGVSPSPEDGNRSSFRNVLFSSF